MSNFINIFIVSSMVGGAIGWFWSRKALHDRQDELCQYYEYTRKTSDLWRKMTGIPDINIITMKELEEMEETEK